MDVVTMPAMKGLSSGKVLNFPVFDREEKLPTQQKRFRHGVWLPITVKAPVACRHAVE
jgi:hypothetical protein